MDICKYCGKPGEHASGCPVKASAPQEAASDRRAGGIHEMMEHTTEEREAVERFIRESLLEIVETHLERFNEGNNGVVLRLNIDDLPESLVAELRKNGIDLGTENRDRVVKILKLYRPGAGRTEFENQQRAFEIVEAHRDNPDIAHVPKPHFFYDLELSEAAQQRLGALSEALSGSRRIEMFMMDHVDGDDIATHMFKEVIRTHPKTRHLAGQVDQLPFPELMEEAGLALGYMVPGGKARGAAERQFEERKVFSDNAKLLYSYLERNRFQIHPDVIRQIEETMKLFHENGLAFRDSHHRNFIVEGDLALRPGKEDPGIPRVHIIDYGGSVTFEGELTEDLFVERVSGEERRYPDDFAVARELAPLAIPPDERKDAEARKYLDSLDSLGRRLEQRIGQDAAWESFIDEMNERMKDGASDPDAAYGVMLRSPAKSNMDYFLASVRLRQKRGGIDSAMTSRFLEQLMKKAPTADKNKIARFLKDI